MKKILSGIGVITISLLYASGFEFLSPKGKDGTVSPRTESNPQPREWKTLSGEMRTHHQAEELLRKVLKQPNVSALSVAVVEDCQIVFQKSLGLADAKCQKKVGEKTVFRTASLTKPVFAYLAMKLIDEGLLEIDRPLHEYLDRPLYEYPGYEDLKSDYQYKLLTVRLLLSHQSGFPNWRMMNRDRRLDFKFKPGEMFRYSGEGYQLLKFIIEKITGKDLNQLAKEKIFEPLGMANSSFLWEKRFDGNFAINLDTGLRQLLERTKTVPNAAASLLTNAGDYAKFLVAVMNGTGLKPDTLELMLTPQVAITSKSLHAPQGTDPGIHERIQLEWALGWGRFRSPHGEAIFHVGFEEG